MPAIVGPVNDVYSSASFIEHRAWLVRGTPRTVDNDHVYYIAAVRPPPTVQRVRRAQFDIGLIGHFGDESLNGIVCTWYTEN